MSEKLFTRLKAILKSRDLTYQDIAQRLSVSEITVKRIFSEKDCKLSRLASICRVAGIDLNDLVEAEGSSIPVPHQLTDMQSNALAENRSLFAVFLLLLNRYKPTQLIQIYNLPRERMYLYLRELEELGLVRIRNHLEAELTVPGPVDFVSNRILAREIRHINKTFVAWTFDHKSEPGYEFQTLSRHLSKESAQILRNDLDELATKFKKLAQRDALLTPESGLEGFKLTAAFGPTPFRKLFSVTD